MDIKMWIKALQVIPRLDKAEWDRLDIVARWLIASRAAVLVMTFTSAVIAGLLAFRDGQFVFLPFLAVAVGLVLAHATNNLLNDLTDYIRGVDHENYFRAQYGPQPLEHGLLTKRGLFGYAAVTGLLALTAGLYLVWYQDGLTLLFLGLGAIFVLFYTWPLKYIGLGEIAVLIVWGPLMIGGGYYTITGNWDWNVFIASLPYALAATTVIFGKHIDKLEADQAKKIRTLPVLLGEKASRYLAIGMFVAQYLLVLYLVVTGYFSPVLLIVFLAYKPLLLALRMYTQPRPKERPADFPEEGWPLWFVAFAFLHTRRFGGFLMLGIILDVLIRQLF